MPYGKRMEKIATGEFKISGGQPPKERAIEYFEED